MSWDSYLDNLLAQSRDQTGNTHADKACIIGLDGGAKWTTDTHANALRLTADEAANIAGCFKSGDFTPFMSEGIHAEGTKYQFLKEDDRKLVLAKKKDLGGLTLQKSKTAIVIAHAAEGKQHGNVNKAVNVIAEYLESVNM